MVFPLSTWGEQRLPLAGWLIDELTKRYDVPQKVAQAWIEHDRVLPLLDGLDEVKEEHRAACVEAINDFRKEHGFLLPLAVCCRVADYDAIGKQLRLQGAILVQPLTRQQVEIYLDQLGEAGVGVRNALREDPTLWELAEAPLLLNVMTLAYSKEADVPPFAGNTPEARREHLFNAYVNRMFQRRSSATLYTKEQTLNWLSWLAQQMQQHALTVFYIERLQPYWLSARQQTILNGGCLLSSSDPLSMLRRADRRAERLADRAALRAERRRADRRAERRADPRAVLRADRRAERRADLRADRRADPRADPRADLRADRWAERRADRSRLIVG